VAYPTWYILGIIIKLVIIVYLIRCFLRIVGMKMKSLSEAVTDEHEYSRYLLATQKETTYLFKSKSNLKRDSETLCEHMKLKCWQILLNSHLEIASVEGVTTVLLCVIRVVMD